jgi:hypothetical protein
MILPGSALLPLAASKRAVSSNIRNEMTIEDIVANIGGGEIHPPPNREQSHANS